MLRKISRWRERFFTWLKVMYLRARGAKIGHSTRLYGPVYFIGNLSNLTMGDRVVINHGTIINCRDKITLGTDVHLSAYCQLQTAGQYLEILPRKHYSEPIVIEDNCWIASGAIITAGTTIKKNCVLGANSVIFGSTEENSFYAGAPATLKKKIEYKD